MKPLVSNCCTTCNYEKSIRDASEGFLNQKTNFPIDILTRDGASSDDTTNNVCHQQTEHPELITRKFVRSCWS